MATLTKVAVFGGIASVAGAMFLTNRIHGLFLPCVYITNLPGERLKLFKLKEGRKYSYALGETEDSD